MSTHKYKAGDRVRWNHNKEGLEDYIVVELRPDNHKYKFLSINSDRVYNNIYVAPGDTSLVLSSNVQEPVDVCVWSTKQLIDVEPVYYRVYGTKRIMIGSSVHTRCQAGEAESANLQKIQSNALVIKYAQSVITEVPFCGFANQPIEIIGISVEVEDRWKAQAYLYCKYCNEQAR